MEQIILYINNWDSRCGFCDESCDPEEISHGSVLGYSAYNRHKKEGTPYPAKGCGQVYTALSSDYTGDNIKEAAQSMRPDLPWVGYELDI